MSEIFAFFFLMNIFYSHFPYLFRSISRSIVHVILSKNESIVDFYMDAVIDGAHTGVFRSEAPANWHRKHKQHHNGDRMQSKDDFINRKLYSSHFVGNNVTRPTAQVLKKIRVDESGIEIPNNGGERMTVSIPSNTVLPLNYSTSMPRRSKRLKMGQHIADHCAQEFWNENINPGGRTVYTRRWSYSKADLKNKTVTFRFVEKNMI